MTVRVANDFKTEAQQELQQLVLENKMLKDKVRNQEHQIEKLKTQNGKIKYKIIQYRLTVFS